MLSFLIARVIFERLREGKWDKDRHYQEIIECVSISIAILLAVLPDSTGLFLVVSITKKIKDLLQHKALVRKLDAISKLS